MAETSSCDAAPPTQAQILAQVQGLGLSGQTRARHDHGLQAREHALVGVGKPSIGLDRHHGIDYRIPQEFEPFVVLHRVGRLVAERRVRQGLHQQGDVGKDMTDRFLKSGDVDGWAIHATSQARATGPRWPVILTRKRPVRKPLPATRCTTE